MTANRPMTPRERDRRARKYRLMAGQLHADMYGKNMPQGAADSVKSAHDALCRAFRRLEEGN